MKIFNINIKGIMKRIKNLYMFICLIISGLLTTTSCINIEHVDDIPYAAKVDKIVPYAGNRKVDLEIFVSSPQIELLRIYWNDKQSVKEVPIGETGKYLVTIDGLEARTYEFTVYSYDKFRHESLPTKVSVAVYNNINE
jgi:hypothetical protein